MSKALIPFFLVASFAYSQTATVDSIEINQVLGKQLNGAASYVAGKATAVRAFLSIPIMVDPAQSSAVITRNGVIVATLTPQNYDQPTVVVDFLCPSLDACGKWAAGSYVFNVTVNGANRSTKETALAFVERQKLRVLARPVRVGFSGTLRSVPDQAWRTFWTFTRAVYPVADDGLIWVTQDELDLSNLDVDTDDGRAALWQALTDLQPKECAVNPKGPTCFDLVVGFIGQNPKSASGAELAGFTYGRPGNIVVATDPDAAASVAHEIAHTFGIGDTYPDGSINCAVNPAPDVYNGDDFNDRSKKVNCTAGRIPYAPSNSGTLVPATANPYEVGGRGALPDMVDYMGSGTPLAPQKVIWTTPDAYQRLFLSLAPTVAAPSKSVGLGASSAATAPVVEFSGFIDAAGTVTLHPWESFDSSETLSKVAGAYTVRAVDVNGIVLATQGFNVEFYIRSNPPTMLKTAPFGGSIAYPANTAKFQILNGTTVVKELAVSKNAPVVNSVAIAEALNGTVVANGTISWTATDADNNKLTYNVFYDPDTTDPNGDLELLVSNTTATFLTHDFSTLPGGNHAGIIVEANDGLRVGSRQSTEFKVPFKRPEVIIDPLPRSSNFSAADSISLSGYAFDAQDELVDGASLVWSSNISGRLGVGDMLSVKLVPGEHLVTLTATNKAGLSSSASVTIRIGARSVIFAAAPQTNATTVGNTFGSSTLSAQIAAGVLISPASVSLEVTPNPANAAAPAGLFFAGRNFDLAITPMQGPPVTTVAAGIALSIGFSAPGDATTIRLFRWSASTSSWIDAATECQPASTYDRATAGKIGLKVCRTGSFALAGIIQPAVLAGGVVNGASGVSSTIAPGAYISLYGANLSRATAQANAVPLGTSLGGVSVMVNGNLPAPLYYVSPGQLNIQLPFETPIGPATLTLTRDGLPGPSIPFTVVATGPGILVYGGNRAVAVNFDNGAVNGAQNPAKAGSVVTLYMTGQGALDRAVGTGQPAPSSPLANVAARVTATIGGVDVRVLFAGMAPGFIGLTQLNLVVPTVAGGDQPLQVTIGGTLSNTASITVQP